MNTLLMLVDAGYALTVMQDDDGIGDYDIIVTHGNGYDQSFKGDDVPAMIFDIAIKLLADYEQ